MITEFIGEYRWLSNFSESPLTLGLLDYPTVEHAFQAQKPLSERWRIAISQAKTPGEAKGMGRRCAMRPDWDSVKRAVMLEVVLAKFSQNPELLERLKGTGDEHLVEGNTWGDSYWGAVRFSKGQHLLMREWGDEPKLYGYNWLGRILMMTREVLT